LPNWGAPLRTPAGHAYLVGLSEVKEVDAWRRVWLDAGHDYRFYEILDGTIPPFEYHYLILEDITGRVRAIEPVFVHDQDILEGLPDRLRGPAKLLTRFARFRILWVGPSVGEGGLGAEPQDRAWCAWALSLALPLAARRLRAPLVVLKDFPSELRPVLQVFLDQGFTRIPSMPAVALNLDCKSFDDHLRSVSSKTRGNLRRKFRDAGRHPPISVEVRNDISDRLDELYPLYLQVHNHAAMRFETLTPDYFRRLGREMRDRARFFIWTQEGRPVAFDACFLHNWVLWAEAIGLDYRVALDLHLYFIVKRDVIDWACQNGVRRYASGPLNYDPKLRLGFKLLPLDLYLWHRDRMFNGVLHRVAPWLTPARHEPLLKKFPNAHEL